MDGEQWITMEGSAPRSEEPTEREVWLEAHGMEDADAEGRGKNADRDFGVFFTSQQARHVMGISWDALANLRKRGRIVGYRKSRGRWWFYRKDDVYALLADSAYRRNSARKKSRVSSLLTILLTVF